MPHRPLMLRMRKPRRKEALIPRSPCVQIKRSFSSDWLVPTCFQWALSLMEALGAGDREGQRFISSERSRSMYSASPLPTSGSLTSDQFSLRLKTLLDKRRTIQARNASTSKISASFATLVEGFQQFDNDLNKLQVRTERRDLACIGLMVTAIC